MQKSTKLWRVEQVKQIIFGSEETERTLPQWLDFINSNTPSQYSIRNTKELAQIFKTINLHGELELFKESSDRITYYSIGGTI